MANTETKVAVVTGASQGIGAAIVQGFRTRNYRVIAMRSIKSSADANVVPRIGCSRRRWIGLAASTLWSTTPETIYRIFRRRLCRVD